MGLFNKKKSKEEIDKEIWTDIKKGVDLWKAGRPKQAKKLLKEVIKDLEEEESGQRRAVGRAREKSSRGQKWVRNF